MLWGWQAYLVLKEKAGGLGHTHAFAFPSPQHSLDTEKVGVACCPSCSSADTGPRGSSPSRQATRAFDAVHGPSP